MPYRRQAMVLVLVVALLALLGISSSPSGINISGEGVISLETRVALAAHIESQDIAYTAAVPGSEIIEARNRNSKTHWLSEDSYSWDGSIGAIHYEDNGWQEIDNIFESAVAPWDWQMLHAGYHIRVKEDFTAGQIIEFEKQGETVQFQPMALEWTNDIDQIQPIAMPVEVAPVITNPEVDLLPAVSMPSHQGTIRWNDAYGDGIDFEWKCSPTRLLKKLEVESLNKLPIPDQYIINGGNPVLRLNLIFAPSDLDIYVDGGAWDKKSKKQTFSIIEFRKDGEVLWGFMPLRYWDSSNDNKGQSVATLEKRGNKLYISIRVPYDWLQSATYPVFIDVDVDEQVEADLDDASEKDDGTVATDINGVPMGDWFDYQFGGVRFSSVVIAAAATIDNAKLIWVAINSDTGSFENDLYGEDAAAPAQFTAGGVGANTITDRVRTTAVVQCDSSDLGNWLDGSTYDSPDIKDFIQELVDTYDYSSGRAIVVLSIYQSGTGERVPTSHDSNAAEATKLHIGYSTGSAEADISSLPTSKSFGVVQPSSTYWADGAAPNWPLDDSECFFTITNNGDTCSITIEATNFTGGVGWTLSGSPGENICTLKAGVSGDANEGAMVTLTTSPQSFISALAGSATKKWEVKLETPTAHTDGAEKTSIITLAGTLD